MTHELDQAQPLMVRPRSDALEAEHRMPGCLIDEVFCSAFLLSLFNVLADCRSNPPRILSGCQAPPLELGKHPRTAMACHEWSIVRHLVSSSFLVATLREQLMMPLKRGGCISMFSWQCACCTSVRHQERQTGMKAAVDDTVPPSATLYADDRHATPLHPCSVS